MKKTQFDWQADEDEELGTSSLPVDGVRQSRYLLVLGSIILFVAVAGLTYWMVRHQHDQMEENVRTEVKSSFSLLREAVDRKDSELYANLLANDGNWQRIQKRLFEKDLILNRSFLGLQMKKEMTGSIRIELDADWHRATVYFEQDYEDTSVDDFMETVRLLHTFVFENQEDGWLQSEPDELFWGDWQINESEHLIVQYPERDARVVQRISQRIEVELQNICSVHDGELATVKDPCERVRPFFLRMSTDADSLNALDVKSGPTLHGRVYQMPSPTLVGLPVDETSYHSFYKDYTRKLINDIRMAVSAQVILPQQVVRTLCFDHPSLGLKLYQYDPVEGIWQSELPDRTFRFLESLPSYKGVFLQEIFDEEERTHARLIYWDGISEQTLFEEVDEEIPYRVINSANAAKPYLLLQRRAIGQSLDDYGRLDLHSCDETGCEFRELPGFMIWKPPAEQPTILAMGSEIHLSDKDGQIGATIAHGYSPFWIDHETIGHIRYTQRRSGLTSEVVLNKTNSEYEQVLFDGRDLAMAAEIDEGDLFIQYVAVSPQNSDKLLINASGLRDYAGEYFIFSYEMSDNQLEEQGHDFILRLHRKGAPGGDLSYIAPTGFQPFLLSPDGNWLLISELTGENSGSWTFLLQDLKHDRTDIISDSFPIIPAQFPSYAWSEDGQWLVIADDGFFRLIAPDQDYEQLIEHDFDYCMFTKWSG